MANFYNSNVTLYIFHYSAYVDEQKVVDYEQHYDEMKNASEKEDFKYAVKKIEEYVNGVSKLIFKSIRSLIIQQLFILPSLFQINKPHDRKTKPIVKSEPESEEEDDSDKSDNGGKSKNRLVDELTKARAKYNEAE